MVIERRVTKGEGGSKEKGVAGGVWSRDPERGSNREMAMEGGTGRTEVQREKGVEETEPRPRHTGEP